MVRKMSLVAVFSLGFLMPTGREMVAQENPDIHVVVNMVQLNVAVTDKKGNYVTALKPEDFQILEDGIVEKPATFAEGNGPARNLGDVVSQNSGGPARDAEGKRVVCELTERDTSGCLLEVPPGIPVAMPAARCFLLLGCCTALVIGAFLAPALEHISLYHFLNERHRELVPRVGRIIQAMAARPATAGCAPLHRQGVLQAATSTSPPLQPLQPPQ